MNQVFALQQTAQELRDQIRTSVESQIREAQGQSGRQVVVTTPDGKTVTVTRDGVAGTPAAPTAPGQIPLETQEFIRTLDVPPRAESVAYAFLMAIVAMVIFGPIARAMARKISRSAEIPQVPAQVTAQLTQLNQAVDAIAIEVERISEGQRFTTKLLSEQQKAAKGLPSP